MPTTRDTATKQRNETFSNLKSKKVSNKLPPGVQMAQKLKKRPVSATEPRECLTSSNRSNEFKALGIMKYPSTGGIKISDNNAETPFISVFPSNVVKKATKNSGCNNNNKESNSHGPPLHAATTTTAMTSMASTLRKPGPGIFTSPPVTAQNLLSALKSSYKKSSQLQKKPKSAGSVAGGRPKDTKVNTSNGKPRAKTAAPDFVSLTTHPHASPFAKSAAKTLANAKVRAKDKIGNFMETKVVLAPRFGIESNEPSNLTLVAEDDEGSITSLIQKLTRSKAIVSSNTEAKSIGKSGDGCFENNNLKIKPNANFTTEKSRWVQMALDNLSHGWRSTGIFPHHLVDSPEFQNKIGELYDIAVEKKLNEIRSQAEKGERYLQESGAAGHSRKSHDGRAKTELSEEIQKKMSDILLQLLLKKLTPEKPVGKRDAGTNTGYGNGDRDDIKDDNGIIPESNSSSSGELEIQGEREIKTCFVFDGRIIPVDTPGNQNNSFASLSESRKRNDPRDTGYFRRVSDLRGFEPEEIKLKYVKKRIFVEGRQGQKDERNARLIREIVTLPKGLDIEDVKVMRGKKGLIVFEEISKAV